MRQFLLGHPPDTAPSSPGHSVSPGSLLLVFDDASGSLQLGAGVRFLLPEVLAVTWSLTCANIPLGGSGQWRQR